MNIVQSTSKAQAWVGLKQVLRLLNAMVCWGQGGGEEGGREEGGNGRRRRRKRRGRGGEGGGEGEGGEGEGEEEGGRRRRGRMKLVTTTRTRTWSCCGCTGWQPGSPVSCYGWSWHWPWQGMTRSEECCEAAGMRSHRGRPRLSTPRSIWLREAIHKVKQCVWVLVPSVSYWFSYSIILVKKPHQICWKPQRPQYRFVSL